MDFRRSTIATISLVSALFAAATLATADAMTKGQQSTVVPA
jgi:hypothetical protein